VIVVVAAACSSDSRGTASGSTQSSAKPCLGQPLKFTSIAPLSGPVGATGTQLRNGTDSALKAINRDCALGRPLQVTFCDDKGNVNDSLACGRTAASDGSLAIVTSVGSFEDGANASGLPGLFLRGSSAFELTNAKAYSSTNGIVLGMAGASAVKALGGNDNTLVIPDSPALTFAAKLIEKVAGVIGVTVGDIFYPADTTDYAPLAAQISARNTRSVGMVPINAVAMVNALADEGITADNHILVLPSATLTPDIITQLGSKLNGVVVVSEVLAPTDTSNEGIVQFRADMQAADLNPDDSHVDFAAVEAWSNIRRLDAALLAAGPSVVSSLDANALVDAVVSHPIDRPEIAPYDFRTNQFPEVPDLAALRVFTRKVAILQLKDGKYNTLSHGFIDPLNPPNLR
jgi:ABC-type branched-subunit amino acid transport system substrate-binding protein